MYVCVYVCVHECTGLCDRVSQAYRIEPWIDERYAEMEPVPMRFWVNSTYIRFLLILL